MSKDLVIAPAPTTEGFIELGRVGSGRIFKKMILHMGSSFVHPNKPKESIKVTPELALSLMRNFQDNVCDIVQVPIVDDSNAHTEDPLRNLGEVIDLQSDDKGIYAIIDARKPELAEQLGKTLIGASAMMHMNYADTKSGARRGPTLLHVAVTNRPYITDLEGYEEIVRASADQSGSEEGPTVLRLSSRKANQMTLEELLATLKDEHGIDVEELQAASNRTEVPVALSNALSLDATSAISLDDIAAGVVELSSKLETQGDQLSALTDENQKLKFSVAESHVDDLIELGRVLPKQRDDMIALSLFNPEMFNRLVPETAIVSLGESGVTTHDERPSGNDEAVVNNYIEMAKTYAGTKRK